eukprot:COSAG01_NODE_1778_length_9259_cov_4.593668_7_plen_62_part_00
MTSQAMKRTMQGIIKPQGMRHIQYYKCLELPVDDRRIIMCSELSFQKLYYSLVRSHACITA